MALHNQLGRIGEEEACRYLTARRYHLLSRNWRVGHLEIDIVADYFGELVFVEVKTRRSEDFMPAAQAVDQEKRRNLLAAARAYVQQHGLDQPVRFDVITVVGEARPYAVTHKINAFSAETMALEERGWRL